jgi:hypothetical protein
MVERNVGIHTSSKRWECWAEPDHILCKCLLEQTTRHVGAVHAPLTRGTRCPGLLLIRGNESILLAFLSTHECAARVTPVSSTRVLLSSRTAMEKRSGVSKVSVIGRQPLLDRHTAIARGDQGHPARASSVCWPAAHPLRHTPRLTTPDTRVNTA